MPQNTDYNKNHISTIDSDDCNEKQQPDKKQKLSFGMMKKSFPTKTGIKITLNSPATVSIHNI